MKFGLRIPSLNKRIAARTSWKRVVRHRVGLKAPRGFGWVTDPKRALYNRVYNRTTFSLDSLMRPRRRRRASGGSCLVSGIVIFFVGAGLSFGLALSSSPLIVAALVPVPLVIVQSVRGRRSEVD